MLLSSPNSRQPSFRLVRGIVNVPGIGPCPVYSVSRERKGAPMAAAPAAHPAQAGGWPATTMVDANGVEIAYTDSYVHVQGYGGQNQNPDAEFSVWESRPDLEPVRTYATALVSSRTCVALKAID